MRSGLESWVTSVLPLVTPPTRLIAGGPEQAGETGAATTGSHAPILLGSSALSFAAAQVAGLKYGSVLFFSSASPSAADVLYLISYLLLLGGTVALCGRRLPAGARLRIAADHVMILSAAATFSWYFIVGPLFSSHRFTPPGQIMSVSYAGIDLLLVLCLLALASQLRDPRVRPAAAFLGLGLLWFVGCHSVLSYEVIRGGSASVPHAGLLWFLGSISACVAAAIVALARRETAPHEQVSLSAAPPIPGLLRYLLPYGLIPGVVVLMVYQARLDTPAYIETGVFIAASIMFEMAFVHQFLAYRDLTAYANRSARLESLAAADPVTGLPNQRSVIAALDALMHKAGQSGTRVSVLFLDLDRFKALNDRFGHAAGDRALREFAAVVRTALRAEDVFGRWGGEEFVALLPGTDRLPARAIAQRICDSVATHTFRTVGGTNVTCSIGVATYPLDARDLGSVVEAADTAMYAAKQRGRNRVIVAGAPDSSTWEEQSGPATPPGLTG